MAGFMNYELIKIRDNMVCGTCKTIFAGTDTQARHKKYRGRTNYCSKKCRTMAMKVVHTKNQPYCENKECPRCKKIKGRICFSLNSKAPCGLQTYCKACISEMKSQKKTKKNRIKKTNKQIHKEAREQLRTPYVKLLLRKNTPLRNADFPIWLIELKKIQIQIYRELRKQQ